MAKALQGIGTAIAFVGAVALTGGAALMGGFAGATTLFGISAQTLVGVGSLVSSIGGALSQPKVGAGGSPSTWTADPNAPLHFAAGRIGVAGQIVYRAAYGPNDRMYQSLISVVSAAGPIDGWESFKADDIAVTFDGSGKANSSYYANVMWRQTRLGAQPDTALTSPSGLEGGASLPSWGSSYKLSGKASYILTLAENSKRSAYQGREPEPLNVIRGLKVYDPRLDSTYPGGSGTHRLNNPATWTYSNNPILWGLKWSLGLWEDTSGKGAPQVGQQVGGIGAPIDSIDVASFIEAANIADANGWTTAAWPSTDDDKAQVLDAFLQAGGGYYIERAGKIACLHRAAPRASVATISAQDTAGPLEIDTTASRIQRKNAIVPSIWSEADGWQITAIEEVTAPEWVAEDGGRKRSEGVTFPYVTDASQAAQLACLQIAHTREGISGRIPLKPYMQGIEPGDCFTITEPGFVLDGLKCLCLETSYDAATGVHTVTFVSETDGKYPYALGQTQTPPAPPALDAVDPTYVTPPLPDDWVIVPRPPGTGGQVPGFDLSGQVGNDTATAIHVEWWEVPANIDPNDPPPAGADWQSAGTWPPTATTIPIDVQPDRYYWIGLSYVRNQNYSERTLIGPWLAGKLIADDVTAIGGQPVQDVLDRLTDTQDLVASVSQAVDELEAAYGDTASAAESEAQAAASAAAAILAKADAIAAKEDAVSAAGASASSASQAGGFKTDAETAAAASQTERIAAEAARDDADDAALAAASSESNAAASETAAGQKAAAAEADRVLAQTARSQAQTAATNAATSETNAAGSASQASISQQAAANSRDAAAGSASAAAGSASTASTKAEEAGNSASAANAERLAAEAARNTADERATASVTSAAQAAASATDAGEFASASEGSATQAATAAGSALTYRDQASTSAANANTAAISAGVSATSAASRAGGNIVAMGSFSDGTIGTWTGSVANVVVSGVPDGSTRALRSTNRDAYEGSLIPGVWGGRRLRVSGYAVAPGPYPLRIGIHGQTADNGSNWVTTLASPANTTSWATFSGEIVVPAAVNRLRPFIQSEGPQGAPDHNVQVATLRIEDVTESASAANSAAVATSQAASASASASAASMSANLAANTSALRGNLLTNGGMERGLKGLGGSNLFLVNSAWGATVQTAAVGNGTYGITWPPVSIFGGARYTVSGDALLFAQSGSVYFDMIFMDSAGNIVLDSGQVARGPGDYSNSKERLQEMAYSTVAPSNATKVIVRCIFEDVVNPTAMGARRVKLEQGDLPATPYTAEATVDNLSAELSITADVAVDAQSRMGSAAFEVLGGSGGDPAQLLVKTQGSTSLVQMVASALRFCNVVGGAVVDVMKLIGGSVYITGKLLLGAAGQIELDPAYPLILWKIGSARLAIGQLTNDGLIFWFGPNMPIANMRKNNAGIWMDTSGSSYFGGALSAGTLTNKASTSSLSTAASVETPRFNSNGGPITVVYSITGGWQRSYYSSTNIANQTQSGSVKVELDRSINGEAYQNNVSSFTAAYTVTRSNNGFEPGLGYLISETGGYSGSVTYTDPQQVAQDRQFRARITAFGPTSLGNAPTQQTLSIIAVEQ